MAAQTKNAKVLFQIPNGKVRSFNSIDLISVICLTLAEIS